jgi:RNA polymerase sigma-70 factor (ECF subfamily)
MGESPESVRFDAVYLDRLREGDPDTQRHFCDYFGVLLQIKLANGVRSWQMLQDVRQETLLRVLQAVQDGKISQPAGLGAFVWTTSNYVLWQFRRAEDRYQSGGAAPPEPADERMEIERDLIRADLQREVHETLSELGGKDREILRQLFFEERDKVELSHEMGVSPEYLRVLLHRAKERFRNKSTRRKRAAAGETK